MVAILRRVSRMDPSNITLHSSDVLTFRYNAPETINRLEEALRLWHTDLEEAMLNTLIILGATGCVILVLLAIVAFWCFAQTANSLGSRTTTTLEAFMVIP